MADNVTLFPKAMRPIPRTDARAVLSQNAIDALNAPFPEITPIDQVLANAMKDMARAARMIRSRILIDVEARLDESLRDFIKERGMKAAIDWFSARAEQIMATLDESKDNGDSS